MGAQELPLQLPWAAHSAHAAPGDLTWHDLPAAQSDAFAGVAVADGMPQPCKDTLFWVHKGQSAHTGGGIPHPHACPPLGGSSIPDRGQSGAALFPAADIDDLCGASPGSFQRFLHGIIVFRPDLSNADHAVSQTQSRCLCRVHCAPAGAVNIGKANDQCPLGEHFDPERRTADRDLRALRDHRTDILDGKPAAQ